MTTQDTEAVQARHGKARDIIRGMIMGPATSIAYHPISRALDDIPRLLLQVSIKDATIKRLKAELVKAHLDEVMGKICLCPSCGRVLGPTNGPELQVTETTVLGQQTTYRREIPGAWGSSLLMREDALSCDHLDIQSTKTTQKENNDDK